MASFTVVATEDIKPKENTQPTLRCLTSELGCLTRQDGSAALSQGNTSSICVVYGPAEVRMNKESIDKATVEVIYKTKVGLPSPEDKRKERLIRNCLDAPILVNLHPRSSVTIVIQETEDFGSNLACCINAACLGLLDAAVNMDFMVAAASASVDQNDKIVVDPSTKDEQDGKAIMTFVFESKDLRVVSVCASGKLNRQIYDEAIRLTRQIATTIFEFYRTSLSKKLLKSS